jgi:hypothetical protein
LGSQRLERADLLVRVDMRLRPDRGDGNHLGGVQRGAADGIDVPGAFEDVEDRVGNAAE